MDSSNPLFGYEIDFVRLFDSRKPPLLIIEDINAFFDNARGWSVSGIERMLGPFANNAQPGQRFDVIVTSPKLTMANHWNAVAVERWKLWYANYTKTVGPLGLEIRHHCGDDLQYHDEIGPPTVGLSLTVHIFDAEYLSRFNGEDSAWYNILLHALPELSRVDASEWFQPVNSGLLTHFQKGHVFVHTYTGVNPERLPDWVGIVGPSSRRAFRITRKAQS
jgi:hypothetical protein